MVKAGFFQKIPSCGSSVDFVLASWEVVPLTTQDGGPILYMSEGRSTSKCHLPSTESIFPWPRVTPEEEALTSRESVLPGRKYLQDLPTNRSSIWPLEASCNLKVRGSLLPGNPAGAIRFQGLSASSSMPSRGVEYKNQKRGRQLSSE